jgi:hypothetical protein
MPTTAQQLLDEFDLLPESEKREVIIEILRRTRNFDVPPLSDDDLVMNAEALFLELDHQEMMDENSQSG